MPINEQGKWKNAPIWDRIWLGSLVVIIIVEVLAIVYLRVAPAIYLVLVPLMTAAEWVIFYLSMQWVTTGYKASRQVISQIGRWTVSDPAGGPHRLPNRRAYYGYLAFSIVYAINVFLLGLLCQNYFADHPPLQWVKWCAFLFVSGAILMGLVPIDIHRWKHLWAALELWICILLVDIGLFVWNLTTGGVWWLNVVTMFKFVSASGYVFGYATNIRAAFLQKIDVFVTTIVTTIYTLYLVTLVL
jgi:hypothetical protein